MGACCFLFITAPALLGNIAQSSTLRGITRSFRALILETSQSLIQPLGDEVARRLARVGADGGLALPDYLCVMLRGNGVAVWGHDIKHAVYKAIYLQRSADVQAAATLQRAHSDLGLTYLNDTGAKDCERLIQQSVATHWADWAVEVEMGRTRTTFAKIFWEQ